MGRGGREGTGGTYNFVLTMFLGCVIRQSQADVAHISLLFLLPSEFERRKSLTFVKRDSRRVNCDGGSVT